MNNVARYLIVLALLAAAKPAIAEPDYDFLSLYPNHRNYYQILVRSFSDGTGDGIGDLIGLREALPFLADFGVEGIWLMPIHPSPSYHGYNVNDFWSIHPDYGTMEDFAALMSEAERLNIDVILDFVINHTSRSHHWFQQFLAGVEPYDQFYVRIDADDPRAALRGSWGQRIWHPLGDGTYYFGYFGGSMPDLNWSNPLVQIEMVNAALYWLEQGVSGFRLDAAFHLFSYHEVEPGVPALEKTLHWLAYFESRLKEITPHPFTIGEIWRGFDIYNQFLHSMTSVHHFEFGYHVNYAIQSGHNPYFATTLERWHRQAQMMDDIVIEGPFLRNHDQTRLASDHFSSDQLRLAAEMLLTVPGNPFIYYGEELGMRGESSGRGPCWDCTLRLPYLWGDERQPTWTEDTFGVADTYNTDVPSVMDQRQDPSSLWNTYRSLLHVRQQHPALRLGTLRVFEGNIGNVQGFYRIFEHGTFREVVLVLHNLSGDSSTVQNLPSGDIVYLSGQSEERQTLGSSFSIPPRSTMMIRLHDHVLAPFLQPPERQVIVHYHRFDENYQRRHLHTWGTGEFEGSMPVTGVDKFGAYFVIDIGETADAEIGLIFKNTGFWADGRGGWIPEGGGHPADRSVKVRNARGEFTGFDDHGILRVFAMQGMNEVVNQDPRWGPNREGFGTLSVVYFAPHQDYHNLQVRQRGTGTIHPTGTHAEDLHSFHGSIGVDGQFVTEPISQFIHFPIAQDADEQVLLGIRSPGHESGQNQVVEIDIADLRGAGHRVVFLIAGAEQVIDDYDVFREQVDKLLQGSTAEYR